MDNSQYVRVHISPTTKSFFIDQKNLSMAVGIFQNVLISQISGQHVQTQPERVCQDQISLMLLLI